ncbi:DNA polymerase alpha/epsilon subunit B-domain-containing protein [Stachybotrys elegans]|uniref:DNA-directed DNA polymerase n=1 Tax=Stachybotrys elegans TaxID=80388 RepID=A0A8K0WRC5_9HYPO|nr:DNA polymerase alpha/epsilon subunit B-domain-containing protein [Stachybotrys elegans]
MVALEDASGSLLQKPSDSAHPVPSRIASNYHPLHTFDLEKHRSYKQQYGDMYFLRLTKLKPIVDEVAAAAWHDTEIGGERAKRVDRVLDVRQGELCWVTGTVYMDLALKPNILEDVSKDRWISAPMPVQKYYAGDESDQTMLEDESGRVRLVGDLLKSMPLVTGCIIAVMGTENVNGELEVIDIKFADLPPQMERWSLSKPETPNGKVKDEDEEMGDGDVKAGNKIAIVSGLSFSGNDASYSLDLDLLLEYLLGEALTPSDQSGISRISRLIIAGNSMSNEERKVAEDVVEKKPPSKRFGYDSSWYNPHPSQLFDGFLTELLPSMPVTLMPGVQDPSNGTYPQQPIHPAILNSARAYWREDSAAAEKQQQQPPGWIDAVTNPWEGEVEGWRVLGTSGQNIDDMCKYVSSDDRIGMMEAMCRWRCCAPTAPDTLWSYPFQEDDPFVLQNSPHVYFVGCQPRFSTKVIDGPEGQAIRLIAVPSFSATRELVLVDTETLEVETVKFKTT